MAGAEVPAAHPQNGPSPVQHHQPPQQPQAQQALAQQAQQQHSLYQQLPQQPPQPQPLKQQQQQQPPLQQQPPQHQQAQQHHLPQQQQQQQQQSQPQLPPAQQQPPHQQGLPQQQQQQQQQQPPQYPPNDLERPGAGRLPVTGKPPAPIQTSTSPAQPQYSAYQPPNAVQRPISMYGGTPQELSTSVYDSPIAPHNPNSAATYTSSVYSPDDPYARASPVAQQNAFVPPSHQAPSAPPAQPEQHRPTYQAYNAYHASAVPKPQSPPQASQPPMQAYGGAEYRLPATNDASYPPQPTAQAPPVPGSVSQQRPDAVLTPPPLHPSGPLYDARQTLPSRNGGGPQDGGMPQYRAYAPSGPPVAGGANVDEGPSAPGDYYQNVAF